MRRLHLGIAILVLFAGTNPTLTWAQTVLPQTLTPLPEGVSGTQSTTDKAPTTIPQPQGTVPQVQIVVPQGPLPPGIGVGGYVYGPTVANQLFAAPPAYTNAAVVVPGYPYAPYGPGAFPPAYPYGGGNGWLPYGAYPSYYGPRTFGYPYYGPFPYYNPVLLSTLQDNARQWGSPLPPTPFPTPLVQRPVRESSAASKQRSLHFVIQGDTWFRKQNYLQAFARYKNAATEAPDLATPHFRMALTLAAQRKHESAVAEIKRGLALDRSWAVTGDSLDDLFGEDNQLAKTSLIHTVAEWVKADIRDPERLFLLGVLLHFNDEAQEASTVLTTAAKLANSPDHIMAFLYPPPAPGTKPALPSDRERLPGVNPIPRAKFLYPTDPDRSRARPAVPDPNGPRPESLVPEPQDVPAAADEPVQLPRQQPEIVRPKTKPSQGPRIPNPSA